MGPINVAANMQVVQPPNPPNILLVNSPNLKEDKIRECDLSGFFRQSSQGPRTGKVYIVYIPIYAVYITHSSTITIIKLTLFLIWSIFPPLLLVELTLFHQCNGGTNIVPPLGNGKLILKAYVSSTIAKLQHGQQQHCINTRWRQN